MAGHSVFFIGYPTSRITGYLTRYPAGYPVKTVFGATYVHVMYFK